MHTQQNLDKEESFVPLPHVQPVLQIDGSQRDLISVNDEQTHAAFQRDGHMLTSASTGVLPLTNTHLPQSSLCKTKEETTGTSSAGFLLVSHRCRGYQMLFNVSCEA